MKEIFKKIKNLILKPFKYMKGILDEIAREFSSY